MGKRSQKANKLPTIGSDVKVTVATAGYGTVTTEFCYSLTLLTHKLTVDRVPFKFDYHGGCYVHHNRNVLLDKALDSDSTHLMFIDTDIAFPPDGVQQLLSHRLPIVGGAYNLKRDPKGNQSTTTVKPLLEDLPPGSDGSDWIMDKSKLFQCRALPTGFMLIHLDTLRQLPVKPEYGGGRLDQDGEGARNWFFFANENGGFVGEDVYFCDYVRRQGVPIWCDPTIKLGHIGPKVF